MQDQYNQTIFRIQDKEGRGPWRPGFSHNWVIPRPVHDLLIPPYLEHPNFIEEIYKHRFTGVGCKSLDQLRVWISKKEYKKLLKYGYQAGLFRDCNIFLDSEIQSIFSREQHLSKGFVPVRLY